MNLTKLEKIFLITLSVLFLTGAVILYLRKVRPRPEIVIVKDKIKEEFTLKQIEAQLKESIMINVNTAAIEELVFIPGIGETLAARIVEYRNKHGYFYTESDLLNVEGIGEKKLEKIKEYIKIE